MMYSPAMGCDRQDAVNRAMGRQRKMANMASNLRSIAGNLDIPGTSKMTTGISAGAMISDVRER